MEYFLDIADPTGRLRKERFAELGAALERAVEIGQADPAVDCPMAVTDTGERLLLGRTELERLVAIAKPLSVVDDGVARQVFSALPDPTLDALSRWMLFRLRASGVPVRARLAMLGAILDAIANTVPEFDISTVIADTNRVGAAVGLFVWSLLVVVMVCDYIVRPRLVGSATPVHPLLVLVALLGGVETFGLWGVLVGPVLMSVCVAALRLYETEFAQNRPRQTLV